MSGKIMILLAGLLLCIPGISSGRDINTSIPCSTSGEALVSGTWNTRNGTLDLDVALIDCNNGTQLVNGTGTISGIVVINLKTRDASVNVDTNFTSTQTEGTDVFNSVVISSAIGSYDLRNKMFSGGIKRDSSGSGTIIVDTFDMIAPSDIFALLF